MGGNYSSEREHEDQSHEDIKIMLRNFLENRAKMIRIIAKTADILDEVHKNLKITKAITSSSGIIGTVPCEGGLVLAIPTAGVSVFISTGGGVLAVASGTAHLGSDIAECCLTKSHMNKLNKLCHADEANILKLKNYLKRENEIIQNNFINENTLRESSSNVAEELSSLGNLTCSIIRVSQAATLTVNSIRFIGGKD